MAAICCCFHIRDPEEEDVSNRQNCICCIIHTLLCKRRAGAATSGSDAISNDIQSNIASSAPRILHFADADATHSDQKQDLREWDNDQGDTEHDSKGNKSTELQCKGRSMENFSDSQMKLSSEISKAEVACSCELPSEDEDVCPICLEEFVLENPKIVLQCSHTYHLSCIYEWMERSENCPICGKMMIFDEAA